MYADVQVPAVPSGSSQTADILGGHGTSGRPECLSFSLALRISSRVPESELAASSPCCNIAFASSGRSVSSLRRSAVRAKHEPSFLGCRQ
jgi:hypothetical protein